MRPRVVVFALAAVAMLPAVTAAQSKKYPPEPVDKDELAAQQSELWDQATNPAQVPFVALLKEAQKLIAENRSESLKAAIGKLDEATKLVPGDAEGYRVRGDAYMQLATVDPAAADWGKCAADYDAAWTRLRTDLDAKNTAELRRRLGLCQARDGKLADAERTLAETAATGVDSVEIWMRLGEVRIAMGKLEGAIYALEASLEQSDRNGHALVRWLLAGAYDRARQPSDARKAAVNALATDRMLSALKNPTLPLLGEGEADFLLGIAYEAFDPPRPEQALVYFRRFLKVATDSPWRKRAEDHVRELRTSRLPDTIDRTSGNAPLDDKTARDTVRRAMPAMRACLAKLPYSVMLVEITRVGPRAPDSERSRYRAPAEGVTVKSEDSLEVTSRATIDGAVRCIEPLAQRLALPKPREKETYYKVQFRVVGP